jgi:hypothetical protein
VLNLGDHCICLALANLPAIAQLLPAHNLGAQWKG